MFNAFIASWKPGNSKNSPCTTAHGSRPIRQFQPWRSATWRKVAASECTSTTLTLFDCAITVVEIVKRKSAHGHCLYRALSLRFHPRIAQWTIHKLLGNSEHGPVFLKKCKAVIHQRHVQENTGAAQEIPLFHCPMEHKLVREASNSLKRTLSIQNLTMLNLMLSTVVSEKHNCQTW